MNLLSMLGCFHPKTRHDEPVDTKHPMLRLKGKAVELSALGLDSMAEPEVVKLAPQRTYARHDGKPEVAAQTLPQETFLPSPGKWQRSLSHGIDHLHAQASPGDTIRAAARNESRGYEPFA